MPTPKDRGSPEQRYRRGVLSTCLLIVCMLASVARGEVLPPPQGPSILSITGNIEQKNAAGAAEFDLKMLEALGVSKLTTSTPWTDGRRAFTGLPLERLLERIGARGEKVVAKALNDYVVPIPLSDVRAKQAFLALKMDGEYLSVRDKGPIWIVFPWDDNPSLLDQTTKHQSIWQLRAITIE